MFTGDKRKINRICSIRLNGLLKIYSDRLGGIRLAVKRDLTRFQFLGMGIQANIRHQSWKQLLGHWLDAMSVWKIIYRSAVQVTLELYGHSRSFILNKTTFTKYCITQWISKLRGSFEIHWVRQYLLDFMGLVEIVNAIVYKNEPIVTGLGHRKLP